MSDLSDMTYSELLGNLQRDLQLNSSNVQEMLMIPGPPVAQSRALEVVYQPNPVRPTFVLVTFALNSSSSGLDLNIQILMDGKNPPTTNIGNVENQSGSSSGGQYIRQTAGFPVPPGSYYKFHSALGGFPIVNSVFEFTL